MSNKNPRELDSLTLEAFPRSIQVRLVREEEFEALYQLGVRHFGDDIASFEVVRRIVEHNPESAYSIGRFDRQGHFKPMGYVAFLFLNPLGVERLKRGELNAADPDLSLIVRRGEKVAGIYVWGIVATGKAIAGLPLVMEILKRPPYAGADLYARPASIAGLNLMRALQFELIFEGAGEGDKPLYSYRRMVNRQAA